MVLGSAWCLSAQSRRKEKCRNAATASAMCGALGPTLWDGTRSGFPGFGICFTESLMLGGLGYNQFG